MSNNYQNLYDSAIKKIPYDLISDQAYEILEKAKVHKVYDGVLYIIVASAFEKTIINGNFINIISKYLSEEFKKENIVNFQFIVENEKVLINSNFLVKETVIKNRFNFSDEIMRYNFNNLVISDFNRKAVKAIESLLSTNYENSSMCNPLFLFGKVGIGKTHIVAAAGNQFANSNPNLKIYYYEGQDFFRKFCSASAKGTSHVEEFKKEIASANLLIFEDIQNIQSRDSAAELFFNIFNDIKLNGGKIILTSDRTPNELNGFHDRIISRLASGLQCKISQPDKNEAIKIINNWFEFKKKYQITDEAKEYIAEGFHTDIRQMIGNLKQICFWADNDLNENLVITKDFIIECSVENDIPSNIIVKQQLKPEQVIEIIAKELNLKVDLIKSTTRKNSIVWARDIVCYVLKNKLNLTLTEIGKLLSGREHTTISHSDNKVEKILADKNSQEALKINLIIYKF
ncbi:AAA family ATPase [Ureaplasma urealyticum]|nr:AAA family ATPase [Ureaplasma urealyticum]